MSERPEDRKPADRKDEIPPTVEDDVEGHGIEEDDADDAAAAEGLTVTGVCV